MKLNHFQQAEVDAHKDAELSWIIQEKIEQFRQDKSNFSEDGRFYRYTLYKKVGLEVNDVIVERENVKGDKYLLGEKEAADCLWDSYKEQFPNDGTPQTWSHWDDLVFPFLDSLIYKSLLRIRVPRVIQSKDPYDNYWPFGQEGGFCNPMKLKMMDD